MNGTEARRKTEALVPWTLASTGSADLRPAGRPVRRVTLEGSFNGSAEDDPAALQALALRMKEPA